MYEAIFASSLLTFVSYFLRFVSQLEVIAPFIQLACLIITIAVVFRFHFYYSTVMSITGYVGYGVLQMLYLILGNWIFSTDVATHDVLKFFLQGTSVVTIFLIGWIIDRKDVGFDYVIYGKSVTIRFSKTKLYLIGAISSFLALFGFVYLLVSGLVSDNGLMLLFLVAVQIFMLYKFFKKTGE
ncbi:hypothetical protein [Brevibacillus porteri]|uniref:hypothetical protein n=1 Tax=Brevibacillus porteri TaxID=2126350 RepID=UPI002E22EA5C|nr:hypothetical protein [Brevibacillus porteri]MED2134733.1 hypothetical protein [Brevibacillus porteri]MED2896326.1 hypothetical protein [Brevibacillus porteri]